MGNFSFFVYETFVFCGIFVNFWLTAQFGESFWQIKLIKLSVFLIITSTMDASCCIIAWVMIISLGSL